MDENISKLLSYYDLLRLQTLGIIENSLPEHVNAASIDITLGGLILAEVKPQYHADSIIHLSKGQPLNTERISIPTSGYVLEPGKFILAQSEQVFHLPRDVSALYSLKSSMGRIALEHMNAGWCDAGWNGSVLTLELKNMSEYHRIVIKKGDRIGQLKFFMHEAVPEHASYAKVGRYNGDMEVAGARPRA